MNTQLNMAAESAHEWGGSWTEKKLDAFTRYVSAYLIIMRKNRYWKTIYFDGFAGSGNRRTTKSNELCSALFITEQEEKIYKGAAERVLCLPDGLKFDYHYFIDLEKQSLDKLYQKLSPYQMKHNNPFQYKEGDSNRWIVQLSNALRDKSRKLAALVLLDPFGMQINWESIESLKNTRSDVWILIPTGVIVNRLLDKRGELKHIEKLQSFFGLSENEIRSYFYKPERYNTLFGKKEIVKKITDPIEKIAEIYALRLKTVWKYVTEKPMRLQNSKGVPIFHFVFASNNRYAVKIASQIIEK